MPNIDILCNSLCRPETKKTGDIATTLVFVCTGDSNFQQMTK